MASLQELKRKIKTAETIKQIVDALRMVATVKFRRALGETIRYKVYVEKMGQLINDLIRQLPQPKHPFLVLKEGGKIGVMVVAADKGLCGGFNSNLLGEALKFIVRNQKEKVGIISVGKKAIDFFRKLNYLIEGEFSALDQRLGDKIIDLYLNRDYSEMYLIYTQFKAPFWQKPIIEELLPLRTGSGILEKEEPFGYIFEPRKELIVEELLPQYLRLRVKQAILESLTSEQAARITAMTSAANNAEDLIKELTLKFHRAKQAAITREITEIVRGNEIL